MKIGLFSDSYHPSTNGIVVVIDVLYENLTKLGHEVVVVAVTAAPPAPVEEDVVSDVTFSDEVVVVVSVPGLGSKSGIVSVVVDGPVCSVVVG